PARGPQFASMVNQFALATKRGWYEAYLVSLGARQRLAAHDSSPGGCRRPGFHRQQTKTLGRSDTAHEPPPAVRAEVQYLGRMPWVSRATAIKPDKIHVARGRAKVKPSRVPTTVDLLSELQRSRPQPIGNVACDLCRCPVRDREHRTDVDLAEHVAVGP